MLEFAGFDQGAGLRQVAAQNAPHLLSVVQHGDRTAEMCLLWQVCSELHSTGTTLGVLDTTATETHESPGLQDMLDGAYRPQASGTDRGLGNRLWAVIPAANGMRSLIHAVNEPHLGTNRSGHTTAAQTLNHLFHGFSTLVVYADAETLAETLHLGQSSTVVALSPDMTSLLSAYKSLKQMANGGALQAVSIVTVSPPASPLYLAHKIAKSLQKCTMNFLKCGVQHYNTSTHFDVEQPSDGVRRLVLNVLDNAASLRHIPSHIPQQAPAIPAQFLWSH